MIRLPPLFTDLKMFLNAEVAKLVDARDSKSRGSDTVSVRVRPSAPDYFWKNPLFFFESITFFCCMIHSLSQDQCIFCRIAAGTLSAPFVAANEHAVAFYDRAPQAPIHILVIPRLHVAHLNDLTAKHAALVAGMMDLVRELAQKYGNADDQGFNIKINTGASAGQEVFHFHWHFLARGPKRS